MVDAAFQVSCFIDMLDVWAGNPVIQTTCFTGEKNKGDWGSLRAGGRSETGAQDPHVRVRDTRRVKGQLTATGAQRASFLCLLTEVIHLPPHSTERTWFNWSGGRPKLWDCLKSSPAVTKVHPVWRVSVLNALDLVFSCPSPSIPLLSWAGHQLILIVIRSHPASVCRSEHSGQSLYTTRPESPSAPDHGWLHHCTEGPSDLRLPISLASLPWWSSNAEQCRHASCLCAFG